MLPVAAPSSQLLDILTYQPLDRRHLPEISLSAWSAATRTAFTRSFFMARIRGSSGFAWRLHQPSARVGRRRTSHANADLAGLLTYVLAMAHTAPDGSSSETLSLSSESVAPAGGAERDEASRPDQVFAPGELVGRRYRVIGLLGRGGMGEIYQVEDLELRHEVALKTIRAELADDPGAAEQLKREILLARQVAHANVCRTFDLGLHRRPDGGQITFLTMELLRGEPLSRWLRREGPVTTAVARRWALQIADGLAAAHRAGVVHRDLKSANIFHEPSADGGRLVVADFGLARPAQEPRSSGERSAPVGTPGYMAPEQLEGGEVGTAADVYAAGVVLYEMLAESRPSCPPASNPAVPRPWHAVLARCVAREPRDRLQDGAALLAALRALPDPTARAPRPWRRRAVALAAAAALAPAGAIAWYALAGDGAPRSAAPARPRDARAAVAYDEALLRLQHSDALAARDLLQHAAALAPDEPLLHSALGEVYRQLGDERRAADEARRAFARSQDLPARERMWIEARYREASLDWEMARDLYQRLARGAPAEIELGLGLARALQRVGSPAEVFATLAALRSLPPPAGDDLRIDENEAAMATVMHDWPRAAAAAGRAADRAERQHAWFRAAENRFTEGNALSGTGQPELGRQKLEAAYRLYERVGDPVSQGRALLVRGHLDSSHGHVDSALRSYRESARLSQAVGASREEGLARFALSVRLGRRGELRDALAEAERYLAIGRELGHRGFEELGLALTAYWRAAHGRYQAAAEDLERMLPITRELGDAVQTAAALEDLGRVRLDQGDPAAARRHFQEALGLARARDHAWLVTSLEVGLAVIELHEGQIDGARREIERIRGREPGASHPEALLLAGQIAMAEGRPIDAREATRLLRERLQLDLDAEQRMRLEILEARVLASSRRPVERAAARKRLRDTIERAHGGAWFRPELEARLALAELHLKAGARPAAADELEVVGSMIRGRGARRWMAALERLSSAAR